jgi:hypothetical protein
MTSTPTTATTPTMSKNILYGIIWMLLLFFIAWPVAGFCAGIWIILQVRDDCRVVEGIAVCENLVENESGAYVIIFFLARCSSFVYTHTAIRSDFPICQANYGLFGKVDHVAT